MNSNRIVPDFTEDLVGFMVQSILTISRFPRAPFAMVPLSKKEEVIYGADVIIEAICPLYIQFKRSFAYPDNSTATFIKDRKKLKLDCNPITLYFELRDKKPQHKDFQHNVLFNLKNKLEVSGKGKAFYAAPLFLKRTAYLLAVHMSSLLNWRPWHWFKYDPFFEQDQNILTQTGSIRFQNIPLLKEHIVIPPHAKVLTYKHKYSYLESGKEICFHSPTKIEETPNLGQVIYDFIRFRDGQPTTEMINLQESLGILGQLREGIQPDSESNSDSNVQIINKWLNFGEFLWNNYEIYQFMLLKLKEQSH